MNILRITFLCLISILSSALIVAQDYYSKPTGNLNDLSTWGDQLDGTGAQPLNFSDPNTTYYVHNNNAATISANWEVSGVESKVVVGDGTESISFTIPSGFEFTGMVDVEDNATLILENATLPAIGNLNTGSTVIYAENATEIVYRDYHHLIFDDIDPVFNGDGELEIFGNFTLDGTVNMPDARDADEYDIIYSGSEDQIITGNGNVVRAYSAEVDKTEGTISLAANTTFATDNQIKFVLTTPAIFQDNGNTIHAGNSVNMAGDSEAYELTGTLILNDFESGVVKGSGDGNNFNIREDENENIVAVLNNVTIRAVNSGGQFRFRDGSTDLIKIKGDFVVEDQVEGAVRFYGNTVELEGDFTIEENFLGSFSNEIEHLIFNGSNNQEFNNGYADLEIVELTIDNGNELILNDPLFVDEVINFTNGIVQSSSSNGLYLFDETGVNGASSSSFVNGPFSVSLDNDVSSILTFPVGDAEYRPIEMSIKQTTLDFTWYTAKVVDDAAPTHPILSPLDNVSEVRHYEITQDVETIVEPLSLTLTYDASDNVNEHLNLRIAHLVNNEWGSFGGIGSAATTGNITNTESLESFGLFALAETEPSITNDPEIIVTPTNAAFFDQTLGSPSSEQSFTVQGIYLVDDIEINAPSGYEVSTTSGSDFSSSITLTESNGEVSSTTIYVVLNASSEGSYSGNLVLTSTDADDKEIELEGEAVEELLEGEDLIYYWHFNDMDPDGEDVKEIPADFSAIPGFIPTMEYTGSSNRDIDTYDPGSSLNIQMGESEGLAARVRNESEGRSLLFDLNTTGCENLIFEYAIHRSGSGMLENIIEYSTDGGATFTQDFLPQTNFIITESYELVSINFLGITAAENNPDFIIKITWEGNTQQTNGNNRYDNITLKGDIDNLSISQNVIQNELKLFPNPASNVLHIQSQENIESISIYNVLGKEVLSLSNIHSPESVVNVSDLKQGSYIVKVLGANNLMNNHRFIKK